MACKTAHVSNIFDRQEPAEPSTTLQLMTDVKAIEFLIWSDYRFQTILLESKSIEAAMCLDMQNELLRACVIPHIRDNASSLRSPSSENVKLNPRGFHLLFRFLNAAWGATESEIAEVENSKLQNFLDLLLSTVEVVSDGNLQICARPLLEYAFKV